MPIAGHLLPLYPVARSVKLVFPLNVELLDMRRLIVAKVVSVRI